MRGRECVSPADFVFLSQITQISQIYLLRRVISPTDFTDGHGFFLCGNFFLATTFSLRRQRFNGGVAAYAYNYSSIFRSMPVRG